MPPITVFAGPADLRDAYHRHLNAAAATAGVEIALNMDPAAVDPGTVDYLVYPLQA